MWLGSDMRQGCSPQRRKEAKMSVIQVIGFGFASIVGIAALLMLLIGLAASLSGDEEGAGCLVIGLALAAVAGFIAYVVARV